jgi:TPP-dependent pyruvate/acetoin dehydrogenase alpha subunit
MSQPEAHASSSAPDTPAPLTRPSGQLDHLADLYRQMFLIRRLEEEAARAYAQGKIGGFLHLYIGQEAVGVGAIATLKPEDYVVTTYRDHGVAIAKGMSPKALMAELFGKVTGCSKGLGGSMHLFDKATNMLGGYGIDRDRFFADDELTVEQRIGEAVQRARELSLPTLVEIRTYRFRGHSMSDPAKYRTSEELEERKKKDPLFRARAKLETDGFAPAMLKKLEDEVEHEVQEAVKFAEESPEPDASLLESTTYDGPFAA